MKNFKGARFREILRQGPLMRASRKRQLKGRYIFIEIREKQGYRQLIKSLKVVFLKVVAQEKSMGGVSRAILSKMSYRLGTEDRVRYISKLKSRLGAINETTSYNFSSS